MSDRYDLVVVGAGPAGAAAALGALTARPDARVLLLDRAAFPRDKACGDALAGAAVDELAALGAADAVAGYPPVDRLRLDGPDGRTAAGPLPRPSLVVPRAVLDARLVAAAQRAGATLCRHRVRRIRQRADGVEVDGELCGRVLVGADGATGVVRRAAGLAGVPLRATAVALRGYAPAPPGRPEQLIRMSPSRWPAYAWSFPIGDGRVNVGYGGLARRVGGRGALAAGLAELLSDAVPTAGSTAAATLPLAARAPRLAVGRVLLTGDAAALVNPLSGEGIHYALLSGRRAGIAAVTAADPAAAYRVAMRRALGRHGRHVALAFRAVGSRRLASVAVATAGRRPADLAALADLALTDGTIPAGFALHLLAGLLRG